jgi:hypothetical protein
VVKIYPVVSAIGRLIFTMIFCLKFRMANRHYWVIYANNWLNFLAKYPIKT